ncbi:MAG: hypothetical protein ACXVCO_10100 [Ktedonobacterales bacterium]
MRGQRRRVRYLRGNRRVRRLHPDDAFDAPVEEFDSDDQNWQAVAVGPEPV